MFEAALLLAFGTKMRTDGVAAALQSGGACTLFAEAAGAQGLSLPEFSAATRRTLRKALPHYASQNNPLDVTGQAAVETEMFCARVGRARARSRGGARGVRRVPAARGGRGRLGRADPADRATLAEGDRGGVRVGRDGSARIRHDREAVRRPVRGCRSCRDIARRPARSAPWSSSRARARGAFRTSPPHPNRAKALRLLRGLSGPIDEVRARCVARAVRGAAARGAGRRVTRGRRDGRPRARVPGGGEGARARAAAQGQARRRPTRADESQRRGGGGRRGATGGAPGRCGRSARTRPADGDGYRGTGRRGRRRVVRRLHHDAARRGAGRGRRRGVRRGAPHPRPGARVRPRAGFRLRARRRTGTTSAPSRGRSRRSRAPRTTSATG